MATIGSLSARILADTSGVTRGMALTRSEAKLTRDAFMAMTSDTDRLNQALQTLETAKQKGAPWLQDAEAYAQAVQHIRDQLDPTIVAERQRVAPINEARAALQDQIATYGLSADALQIYRLQQQGATDAEIAEISALRQQLTALQLKTQAEQAAAAAAAAADNAAKQQVDQLREQIATAGMSADQITLWKLSQQGATQAQLGAVAALQKEAAVAQAAARVQEALSGTTREHKRALAEAKLALDAGKISLQQYAAYQRHLRQEALAAIPGFQSFFNALKNPWVAVAAGAMAAKRAIDAFAAGIAETLRNVDELNRRAQQLGVPLDQMARLSRAANLANVATDQLAEAMLELQKRGGDPNLTPTQQLLGTLDALRQYPTSTEQTVAAMAAFGDKGKELLPILRMNQAAYAEWRQTLEQPLAGDAGLANIQEANDAIKQMKIAWEDIWVVMAGSLAPEITKIADLLRDWLSEDENLQTLQTTMENLAGAGELVAGVLEVGAWGLRRFNAEQAKVAASVSLVIAGYFKLRQAMAWATGDQAGAASWASMAKAEMEALRQSMAEVEGTPRPPTAPQAAPAQTPGIGPAAKDVAKRAADATAELRKLAESLQEQQWASQLAAAGYSEAQIQLAKLANQGGDPNLVAALPALQKQAEVAKRAADATAELRKLAESLREQQWASQLAAAGYSEAQIQLAKLANQGADPRLVARTAALQQQTALQAALTETTKRLKDEAATAGKSAEQIELMRLKNLGATDAQLAQVAALQQQSKSQREATQSRQEAVASTKDWQAATRGSSEALDRIEAYRQMLAKNRAVPAAVPPIAAGIQPAVTPIPEGPTVRPIERPGGSSPQDSAGNGNQETLLTQAVTLLTRIAEAAEREQDSITVEQTE